MDKKINNLGKLSGRVLLFGGIYSNFQALEKMKRIAESENISPQNCICTGDIVGYCAQPEDTVQLFKLWGAQSIAGNVEIQLREGAEDCGCDFKKGSRCDAFSQMWYPFAQSQLSKSSLDYMATLPDHLQFEYANKKILVVHGSYFNTSEFIFKSTAWKTKQPNFSVSDSDIIVGGHCGLPFHDQQNDLLWLNPGVIGMPANDGSSKVWYVILEDADDDFNFNHFSFEYDHQLASRLMYDSHLPKAYAQTLTTGIWDNTEILPAIESASQGYSIEF